MMMNRNNKRLICFFIIVLCLIQRLCPVSMCLIQRYVLLCPNVLNVLLFH